MLFGILSAIAFSIGVAGLSHDLSTNGLAPLEEETPIVQAYGPICPAYSEED